MSSRSHRMLYTNRWGSVCIMSLVCLSISLIVLFSIFVGLFQHIGSHMSTLLGVDLLFLGIIALGIIWWLYIRLQASVTIQNKNEPLKHQFETIHIPPHFLKIKTEDISVRAPLTI